MSLPAAARRTAVSLAMIALQPPTAGALAVSAQSVSQGLPASQVIDNVPAGAPRGFVRFYTIPGNTDFGLPAIAGWETRGSDSSRVVYACKETRIGVKVRAGCVPSNASDYPEGISRQIAQAPGIRRFDLDFGDTTVKVHVPVENGMISLVRLDSYLSESTVGSQQAGNIIYSTVARSVQWEIRGGERRLPASDDSLDASRLGDLFADQDWGVRWLAVRGLRHAIARGDDSARAVLRAAALFDRDVRVRNAAIAALGRDDLVNRSEPPAQSLSMIRRHVDSVPVVGTLVDGRGRALASQAVHLVVVDLRGSELKGELISERGRFRLKEGAFSCRPRPQPEQRSSTPLADALGEVIPQVQADDAVGILLRRDMEMILEGRASYWEDTDQLGRFIIMVPREMCLFLERQFSFEILDKDERHLMAGSDTVRIPLRPVLVGAVLDTIVRERRSLVARAAPSLERVPPPLERYWRALTTRSASAARLACDHAEYMSRLSRALVADSLRPSSENLALVALNLAVGGGITNLADSLLRATEPPAELLDQHRAIVAATGTWRRSYAAVGGELHKGVDSRPDVVAWSATEMEQALHSYGEALANIETMVKRSRIDVPSTFTCATRRSRGTS